MRRFAGTTSACAEVSANIIDQCVAQGVLRPRVRRPPRQPLSLRWRAGVRPFYARGQTGQQLFDLAPLFQTPGRGQRKSEHSRVTRWLSSSSMRQGSRRVARHVHPANSRPIRRVVVLATGGYGNVFLPVHPTRWAATRPPSGVRTAGRVLQQRKLRRSPHVHSPAGDPAAGLVSGRCVTTRPLWVPGAPGLRRIRAISPKDRITTWSASAPPSVTSCPATSRRVRA